MTNAFKFTLGQQVQIAISGEYGQIISRAEYIAAENTYMLRYASADGRAVEQWWGESALNSCESYASKVIVSATCNAECPIRPGIVANHDFDGGKQAQPFTIGLPGDFGLSDAFFTVQIYALGRGISIERKCSDLPLSEGVFELEANGRIFKFDLSGAIESRWVIAAVEGNITTIRQTLQAEDKEKLPELMNTFGQDRAPFKTAILSLPGGYGKTWLAPLLAQRLGCTGFVDEWEPGTPIVPGALHLTNVNMTPGARL